MAQKTVIEIVDDLDNLPLEKGDAHHVQFSFDGADYEIDLSHGHADQMRQTFQPYIERARRAQRRHNRSTELKPRNAAVRAWAAQQGIEAAARGRLSRELIEQYQAAHR